MGTERSLREANRAFRGDYRWTARAESRMRTACAWAVIVVLGAMVLGAMR